VYTVASTIAFDATNGVVKAPHGANGYQTGELYTTELQPGVDARVVKLGWTGSGVTFYVSTDGNTWSQLQKDQPLSLGTSTRSLYLKAVLAADASSVLDRYLLQINPTGFNLFTGKMLTEETGLVYFGARWYDPEIGRWITPDPSEDGENWYGYCNNNPVNYVDPDGRLSIHGWGTLFNGIGYGFQVFAPKKAFGIVTAIGVGSALTIGMSALMPILPGAVPVIASVMPYISTAMMVPFAINMVDDIRFLIKEFAPVFLSRSPSDTKIKAYGIRISKVAMDIVAMVTIQKGFNTIKETGILERIGFRLCTSIKYQNWKEETGAFNYHANKVWRENVKAIKNGQGKGINVTVQTKNQALQLINEARPDLQLKPTYSKESPGYEIHPPEPGTNELAHVKWRDWSGGKSQGAEGHIFFVEE
jgi:RHS repeat-associated protein